MAKGHIDLPRNVPAVIVSKRDIYAALARIDADTVSRARVLKLENDFKRKIATHLLGLPTADARFQKFNTSPFVLMFHSRRQGYHYVSDVEKDIIPAKIFSSMETSAGRMVEEVVLPAYGWEVVPSQMHSVESVLDGRRTVVDDFMCATLKSGPRCLNDEMAKDIGADVVHHVRAWADKHHANKVDFTYGVLYGTKRLSNKKDWHILRNMAELVPAGAQTVSSHRGAWSIAYRDDGLEVTATVRVGIEWWNFLGGRDAWLELCIALIRACIDPAGPRAQRPAYTISDLGDILDMSSMAAGFNVAILQASQIEWLLFLARHFCDELQL
jgi:hypothetical protein